MRFGSNSPRALRRIQRKKKGAVVTVTALTVSAVLLLCVVADPRRSVAKEPVAAGDISIVIESSSKERSTKITLDRSYLDLNDPLLRRTEKNPVTDSVSAYLMLPELVPAARFEVAPDSVADLERRNAILATGRFVWVVLHQGTRTPVSASETNKVISWVKGLDEGSFPGFEVFHDRPAKINDVPAIETIIYLVPKDAEYNDRLYIDCPINNINSETRLYCECHTSFADDLYGTFSFSKSRLGEWKSLHRRISEWVQSKIVK